MDDLAIVAFHRPRGTITRGPAAEYAEQYLYDDVSSRYRWPLYFLGLVGVGWFLLAGSLGTRLVTPLVASGVFLTLITGWALTQLYVTWTTPDYPTFTT